MERTNAVVHLFVPKNAKIRSAPVGKNLELSVTAPSKNDVIECGAGRAIGYGSDSDIGSRRNLYVPIKPRHRETLLEPLIVNPKIVLPPEINDLIISTLVGLERGTYPIRSSEGTGGAYFKLDALGTKYLSIFKPVEEEPMAVHDPGGCPLRKMGKSSKGGPELERVESGSVLPICWIIKGVVGAHFLMS